MKKLAAASVTFGAFLAAGSLLVSAARFLPDGVPRSILIIAFGVAFVGVFCWLLVERVRLLLRGVRHLWRELTLTAVNVALLMLAFAAVYQTIGIVDTTAAGEPSRTHDFGHAVYYSIVTFTTLGYGDFYATGIGRVMSAMEALTGYMILGILASTAASILSPHEQAGRRSGEDGRDSGRARVEGSAGSR